VPPPKIQQIQRLLSAKASEEREYRFTNLYSLLRPPLWIETAYYRIRSNKGSGKAGVDGVTRAKWEASLDGNLYELVQEIKNEQFQPLPVKRRYFADGVTTTGTLEMQAVYSTEFNGVLSGKWLIGLDGSIIQDI
jgi:hypothetical protein